MLSSEQIARLSAGTSIPFETVVTSGTVAYSTKVLYPGKLYRIVANDGTEIKPCREYVYGSRLGDDEYDEPATDIFATDSQDAVLSTNFWQRTVVTNEAKLDKDGTPAMGKTRALLLNLADQDDVFRLFLNVRKVKGLFIPRNIPVSQTLQLSVSHIESNAANPAQYQLRCEIGAAQVYWGGAAWGAATWIDITGSASLVTFTDAVTTHTTLAGYSLAFRSKADAAETSHIGWFGLHETLAAGGGTRLPANVVEYFTPRFRCRMAGIADNADKRLYITEMQP